MGHRASERPAVVRNGSGVGLRKALAKHVGAASQPGVRHLFVHSCRSVVVQGVAARSLAMTACPRALAVCGVHQLRTKSAPNGPRQVGSWSTPSSDTIGPKRPSLCRKLEYTKFGRVSVAPWMGFGRAADAVDGVRTSRGRRGCAGWAQRRRVRSGPSSYLRLLRKGLAKPPCCHDAGGLLHHRFSFSLTCLRRQRESSFLRRFPSGHPAWPLASFLPCGARTFLMTHVPYGTQAPRSSGPLRGSDSTTVLPRWVETFVCTQPVPRAARNTPQATGVAARRATACAKLARECIQRQQMCARLLVCLPYDTFWA